MFRIGSVSALYLIASATIPVLAETDLPKIETGISVHWATYSDDYTDRFRERLIYAGADVQIFETIAGEYDDDVRDAEDYFAIFSGIDYVSCDNEMPTDEQRASIAGMRPFIEGASINLKRDDSSLVLTTLEPTQFFLMGAYRDAHKVKFESDTEDASNEVIKVLDDLPLTVAIEWDSESRDTVLLISSPSNRSPEMPTKEQLGNCAALITE